MAGKLGSGRIEVNVGDIFHYWKVVGDGVRQNNTLLFPCQCECGTLKDVPSQALREGRSKSCGCQKGKLSSAKQKIHGMSHTPAHNRWMSMIQRCTDKNHRSYPAYGGRGITICEKWMDFRNFYEDMGDPPTEKHTIDRIDNDKGYFPDNCRWASKEDQANNRRSNKMITFQGITLTQRNWEKFLNVPEKRIYAWLKKGITMAEICEGKMPLEE